MVPSWSFKSALEGQAQGASEDELIIVAMVHLTPSVSCISRWLAGDALAMRPFGAS